MADHLVTSYVFGPCAADAGHASGDPAHIADSRIFCRDCCPVCVYDTSALLADSRPVEGEQGALFG